MRRKKGQDPSLFYIQVHRKHFSTRRTVNRPTIDIVRAGDKHKAERVRLMFPRTMEVLTGSFEVKTEPLFIRDVIGEPLATGQTMRLSAKVQIGEKIFTLTMEQEGM